MGGVYVGGFDECCPVCLGAPPPPPLPRPAQPPQDKEKQHGSHDRHALLTTRGGYKLKGGHVLVEAQWDRCDEEAGARSTGSANVVTPPLKGRKTS